MPPLIYLNSRGAQTYGTTDIGTIYDRIKSYPDLKAMIYETDQRQKLHFQQLFRACRKAGYLDGVEATHIGHGTINGPDGKPFKTRAGGTMKFADMIAAAMDKARERLSEANFADDLTDAEKDDIAEKVAIAALKYTELSHQAHVDYVFDLDKMTQFEGRTGPYLLYQAVRIQSLLRKAGIDMSSRRRPGSLDQKAQDPGLHRDDRVFALQEADIPLALVLSELPDHFALTLKNFTPHVLCDHAYKIAQAFSSFYASCHILSEEDETVRASRLALCAMTHAQLALILDLIGIKIPERM